jgi:hypothetical protein
MTTHGHFSEVFGLSYLYVPKWITDGLNDTILWLLVLVLDLFGNENTASYKELTKEAPNLELRQF